MTKVLDDVLAMSGVLGDIRLSSVAIYGYVYDVKNGQLVEVPEAPSVGQTR